MVNKKLSKSTQKKKTLSKPSLPKISKSENTKIINTSNQTYKDSVVAPDRAFYCSNGQIYYCLTDLKNALPSMDEHTLRSHVNEQKNDFYNWILGVYKYENLARQIRDLKTQKEIQKVLEAVKI